jgi:DHA1 family tetracycline resistance protein-like MFS transporter
MNRQFLMICLGAFLDWVGYGLVFPFFAMLIFQKDSPFSVLHAEALRGILLGILVAASPLAQFFTAPILGNISDRIGRRPLLPLCFIIVGIGYGFSAVGVIAGSFLTLVMGRVITGIGAGNISVLNAAVADLSSGNEKTKRYALLAMASGIGFSAGPFIGGELSRFGFEVPFIFSTILLLLNALFFYLYFSETYEGSHPNGGGLNLFREIRLPSFKGFYLFFLSFFIFCFGWSFYWEFISVTWIELYNLNVADIGNFYAYGSVFYVVSNGLLIRPIIKYFAPLHILMTAWALLAICFILLFHANLLFFWIFIPLQQFLLALVFPVGTTIVSNAVPKYKQGETLGNFQSLQAFAFAITPLLGGVILDLSYSTPIVIGGTAMMFATGILFFCVKKEHL